MSFIVIEGLDGAGKSTQIKLLQDYLETKKIRFKYLHFPRTDAPYYGDLIARFLRGEFGDISSVDPYLVALIYGGDRTDASETINSWVEKGYLVIVDRYVDSNIAFQCAKLDRQEDQEQLRNWILSFEYDYNKIPRPDLVLFLDVPFHFTREKLSRTRIGLDRDYLNGKQDIHEENLHFQEKVRKVYLSEANLNPGFHVIDCSDSESSILTPGKIFSKILALLQKKKIVWSSRRAKI
jgi:dTMP kinase